MGILGQNLKSLRPLQPKLAKFSFCVTSSPKFQKNNGSTFQKIIYGYIWSKSEVSTTTPAKVSKIVLLCYQLTKISISIDPITLQFLYEYFWSKSEVSRTTGAKVSKIVLLCHQLTKFQIFFGPITQQFFYG